MKQTDMPARSPMQKCAGIPNLYLNTPSGVYYSRVTINGRRTWRSLDTNVLTVAKLKHKKRDVTVEEQRQTGATLNSSVRTLGHLAAIYRKRVNASLRSDGTKVNYIGWLDRLIEHWPGGSFDAALPGNVTADTVVELRAALQKATVCVHRAKTSRHGYSNGSINQSLSALRILLDLAAEHHIVVSNPFTQKSALQESLYMPRKGRKPTLPSREDFERIFAEMMNVQAQALPERTAYMLTQAQDAVDHARFLALTGARLEEANAARWEDDKGDLLWVHGTKSPDSDRHVPQIPELKAFLAELRFRRRAEGADVTKGPILCCKTSRDAIYRACDRLGLPRMRHHDMRHYFCTVCIEERVDPPTLADWLGHADGGALLAKTYRHLRQEHSIAAAKRVSFAPKSAA